MAICRDKCSPSWRVKRQLAPKVETLIELPKKEVTDPRHRTDADRVRQVGLGKDKSQTEIKKDQSDPSSKKRASGILYLFDLYLFDLYLFDSPHPNALDIPD